MRILGVDPGSRVTGWAVVEADGWDLSLLAAGVVRLPTREELSRRLLVLAGGLRDVIAAHGPAVVAVEQLFHAKNARSALTLGHARGVALLAAAEAELPLHEYTPAQVKSAVTGYGRADKRQVQQALMAQCGLREPLEPLDASDALAVAACHAGAARLERRLAAMPDAEGLP